MRNRAVILAVTVTAAFGPVLAGALHGCLKTRTRYDEATAWGHRENILQSDAAA